MQGFGISDVGLKRELNEDNFSLWQEDNVLVAVVADGMGGAKAGEVASRMACRRSVELLQDELGNMTMPEDETELRLSVDRAIDVACKKTNLEVFSCSNSDKSMSGMGTTLAGVVVIGKLLWVFHIGDSRVYHIERDNITQLTVDHSFVQALVDAGKITKDEAKKHPNKNIILRAVGIEKDVECDILHLDFKKGYYLICSDGLSNYFEEKRFLKIFNSSSPLSSKAESLIEFANSKGGADNITAVLIDSEVKEDNK